MEANLNRRNLLRDSVVVGVALGTTGVASLADALQKSPAQHEQKEPEVTATEDLNPSAVTRPRCTRQHNCFAPSVRIITKGCWKSSTSSR